MSTLQKLIDDTKKGGLLELQYGGEFNEKITIKKSVTIRSLSSPAIIVGDAPTISILNQSVLIENCIIEGRDEKATCISVEKNCNPTFKNVFVRGVVEGLDEKGVWEYPSVIELPLKADKKCVVKIIIFCPTPAKLISEISPIKCNKDKLVEGINEIEIFIDSISKNSLITGDLIIETLTHNLKRKISLIGNTLTPDCDNKNSIGEYLWVCESSMCNINSGLIKKLPEGFQDSQYQFVIDKKRLNCEEYNISAKDLPEGINLEHSTLFSQISGITKKFGEYDVTFIFQKDKLIFKFPSKLKINKRIITPLKIAPQPDPIELTENEAVSIKVKIVSSNGPYIIYHRQGDFPDGISFDEASGEIFGSISVHGKYHARIKIMDGTNELYQPINFYVKPGKPLNISLEKTYQFYQNDPFNIHLSIHDSKRLNPVVKLEDKHSSQIKLTKEKGEYYLKGNLKKIKKYNVKITVKDKYKREGIAHSVIECIQKPAYTLKWHSKSLIYIKGKKFNPFTEQLKAEIQEYKRLPLKYKSTGKWPTDFHLLENGQLEGQIDGKSHQLQIRVYTDDWYCDKTLEIITIIDHSKVMTSSMQNLFSNAFDTSRFSAKTKEGLEIVDCIKTKLASGRVQEHYEDSLFKKGNTIIRNQQFLVKNLPGGLNFNPVNITIEGTPVEAGVFSLEIYSSENDLLKKIKIEIKTSLFHHSKKINESVQIKKASQRERSVQLGNAFLKKDRS